jgi:hypothetical protein
MNTFVLGRSEEGAQKEYIGATAISRWGEKSAGGVLPSGRVHSYSLRRVLSESRGGCGRANAGIGVAEAVAAPDAAGECWYRPGSGRPLREGRAEALMSSAPGPK